LKSAAAAFSGVDVTSPATDLSIRRDFFLLSHRALAEREMGIYGVFIISKSGGMIFNYDHNLPVIETEKTFSYPLDIKLSMEQKRLTVVFGERDGIKIGHVLLAVNGVPVSVSQDGKRAVVRASASSGTTTNDSSTAGNEDRDVLEMLGQSKSYPIDLKFGRPRATTNEKIVLTSMLHALHALAVQLSPEVGSSGIQELETDTFKLHCSQTLTGVKFLVVAEPKQAGCDQLLDKIYELYSDYALKNPFYSLEMPIRADLFDQHLQTAIDQIEKTGFI